MRYRDRVEYIPPSTYLGAQYMDTRSPYGDGPWYLLGTKYYTVPANTYLSEWKTCLDELHPGPPWRTGGPLDIWELKTDRHILKSSQDLLVRGGRYRYVGGFVCQQSPAKWTDYNASLFGEAGESSYGDTSSYGATGWNRFRPGKPTADSAVFLAELREVPRMFMQTALGFRNLWRAMGGSKTGFGPKSVADHWVNTQFGWSPFLNDLRKFWYTTQNLDKRIAQLQRDNGQWKKCGGVVKSEEEEQVVASSATVTGHNPILLSYFYRLSGITGSYEAVRKDSFNVWFSGRFRYWIPNILKTDPNWRFNAAVHLFGLKPSPSVLWEIMPWSWLIDWCSNVGDVIDNLSARALDNLAAKYAYVMGTKKQEVTLTSVADFYNGPQTETWSGTFTRKLRQEASPFGFDLSSDMFSARQWSILAALGISRSFVR